MASLTKTYDTQKLLGQVYTPRETVEKVLTDIGLNKPEAAGKTVLDPSCGDGSFLTAVAEKIIACSSPENLQANLEKICGWDIDADAVARCIEKLDRLVLPLGIRVRWNIGVRNALHQILASQTPRFDFIVGNPPYIRIQHLQPTERQFIQRHYRFCRSGSTDAYIAFFELCDYLLAAEGKCGLITPNTFLYSQTAQPLRNYFAERQTLIRLTNYRHIRIFDKAATYSAITVFGKQRREDFIYEQAESLCEFRSRIVGFEEIRDGKIWRLEINPADWQQGVKLKDICRIHVGITTLCDKAYIFTAEPLPDEPNYVVANTRLRGRVKLEKAVLKPIIKASRLKNGTEPVKEYILFPYRKVNGKHVIIPEEILAEQFPLAYAYLLSVKPELDKRDNGKLNPIAWYAFGRSQGLDTSFGKKILFAPMNRTPNFVLAENEEAAFYSGYCIKYDGNCEFLLRQLNSQRLADYIAVSSRDFRDGWKAYNKKVLEEFTIIGATDDNVSPK